MENEKDKPNKELTGLEGIITMLDRMKQNQTLLEAEFVEFSQGSIRAVLTDLNQTIIFLVESFLLTAKKIDRIAVIVPTPTPEDMTGTADDSNRDWGGFYR